MRYASFEGRPYHHCNALIAQIVGGLDALYSVRYCTISEGFTMSSQQNVKYYFLECMMSHEQIAQKTKLSIEQVKALLVNPPVYIPDYAPRQRRAFQDHVKPF